MKTKQLISWYLALPTTKQCKSYEERKSSLYRIGKYLPDILSSSDIINLQTILISQGYAPSTINKDVSYVLNMHKKALMYGKISGFPLVVDRLKVNNVRERSLSVQLSNILIDNCHKDIKLLVKTAFWSPMRRNEFLTLDWKQVNLNLGYFALDWSQTKKAYSRIVPINPVLIPEFRANSEGFGYVFRHNGNKISASFLAREFKKATQKTGLEDFVFHDLRHCAANNMRLAGNSSHVIMSAGGWKSEQALKRYLYVDKSEIINIKWG